MRLHALESRGKRGFTTFGGYWEKGEVRETDFSLQKESGEEIPVQSKALAFWPDGSIKWSAHTADAALMGKEVALTPDFEEKGGETPGIRLVQTKEGWKADTGALSLFIPNGEGSRSLAENVRRGGRLAVSRIYPVFELENRNESVDGKETGSRVRRFEGEVTEVTVEEDGPLQTVFCFRGNHIPRTGHTWAADDSGGGMCPDNAKAPADRAQSSHMPGMPFVIRMYLWKDSDEIKFVHTFLFDGREERDFLKGMGIRFDVVLAGGVHNRQIQFVEEEKVFHEAAVHLASRIPRLPKELLREQLAGRLMERELTEEEKAAERDLPVWNSYHLFQDSAYHYGIWKRTKRECCRLCGSQGKRAAGVMALTGQEGGVAVGIRDFWQKYPSGLEAEGLGEDVCHCSAWFYSPMAEAYDFRHYDTRSYPYSSYEGFEEVGASAFGIGVTSECRVRFHEKLLTLEEGFSFAKEVQNPPVFTGEPQYYHDRRAFGYWSLVKKDTEREKWLEEQMERAFSFYRNEVECRDWYGLFDYGDVMHSYDPVRHTWKYDVGGFAWQNTELVPTYWLWLYFLRTGREDVFRFAEAMTRHCSEVDIYHFGPLKGLGSRHNIRHWGCSCKEPRIAMAGHQRFLYYLTGDMRLGDVMEDVKDADKSMSQNPHSCKVSEDGAVKAEVRSGPDWSSYVSNWMTHYERFLDGEYRRKIETGIRDIAATPFGFASGPDYYYDPETAHLIYHGEIEDTPNQHLQIAMGGPQVWLETADMLGEDTLKLLLQRLGSIYFLSKEERAALTGGLIRRREFSWKVMAAAVTGFAAQRTKDKLLAEQTWEVLRRTLEEDFGKEGFVTVSYVKDSSVEKYQEMPGISTNMIAQWCLNVIMCLEFISESAD